MKIWIYLNDIQQGPYSLEEIGQMHLKPSTPVWYDGLSQWLPACEAPLTAALFADSDIAAEEARPATVNHKPSLSQEVSKAQTDAPACPPTFIGWSIFCLICCCQIGGILGIIFSSMVKSSYRRGDYQRAAKMSEYAEWTVILSIVLGLVSAPLTWIMYL